MTFRIQNVPMQVVHIKGRRSFDLRPKLSVSLRYKHVMVGALAFYLYIGRNSMMLFSATDGRGPCHWTWIF